MLPGLAQPTCVGRHIHCSRAARLVGVCQHQPLTAHTGRGARRQVGGSAPASYVVLELPALQQAALPLWGWDRVDKSKWL